MLTLQSLVAQIFARQGTTEAASTGRWPVGDVVAAINGEFRSMRDILRTANSDYLTEIISAATVTKDVAYALPSTMVRLIDVRGTSTRQSFRRMSPGQDSVSRDMFDFEVLGTNLYMRREPGETVEIRYSRDLGDLHYGNVPKPAVGLTVLWLAINAANSTGTVINTADYYNGLIVMIHEGTAAGQFRTVLDHGIDNGFSYVVTEAWDTKPDATSKYCFLPPWPDLFEELLVIGATARAPMTKWRQEALSNPHYAMILQTFSTWAQRSHSGAQSALQNLDAQFKEWE